MASSVTVKQFDNLFTEHNVTSSAGCVSVGKRLLLPVVIRRCFDVRCSHVWWRSILGAFLLVHWSSGTSRNTSVTFLGSEREEMPHSALLCQSNLSDIFTFGTLHCHYASSNYYRLPGMAWNFK